MTERVLIVDDNPKNVRLLKEILEEESIQTNSTDNGSAVLELTRSFLPDVILLDIMMPGLDGFSVCKLLKGDPDLRDIPVIMVTAKTESIEVKRALELGAFDYIKKPIDDVEVVARVKSAIRFKEKEDQLRYLAMRDSLTEVFNHALLVELSDKEYAKCEREGKSISFVMVDTDYFKDVNDTYGHQAGDAVLKTVAEVIRNTVRQSDVVGRYGGEEFGLVIVGMSLEDARNLCERIRINIEKSVFSICGDTTINVTVSIGLSHGKPKKGFSAGDMIRIADEALYEAKKNGRNRVCEKLF